MICPYKDQSKYSWSEINPFSITKANAQASTFSDISVNAYNPELEVNAVLPIPMLIMLLMFVIFTIVMSMVYVYHWSNFSLGDKFIKNGILIYFVGLILLSLPLLLFVF